MYILYGYSSVNEAHLEKLMQAIQYIAQPVEVQTGWVDTRSLENTPSKIIYGSEPNLFESEGTPPEGIFFGLNNSNCDGAIIVL